MAKLHRAVGMLILAIFLGTGAWMRLSFPEAWEPEPAVRFLFRANHVYLLFAALLNLVLGAYPIPERNRRWQVTGSLLLLFAPGLLTLAFWLEPPAASASRPLTTTGVLLTAGGVALHLLGRRAASVDESDAARRSAGLDAAGAVLLALLVLPACRPPGAATEPVLGLSSLVAPVRFEEVATPSPEARFVSGGGRVLVGDRSLTLRVAPGRVVKLGWAGAGLVRPGGANGALSHYFEGPDPRGWRRAVPHYRRVIVEGVSPGVSLVVRGADGSVAYDLRCAPGVDPRSVELRIDGAEEARLTPAGELHLTVAGETLRQHAPFAYQPSPSGRRVVAATPVLEPSGTGWTLRFALDGVDTSLPVVVDPKLEFSTYYGADQVETGWAVAADDKGGVYVAATDRPLFAQDRDLALLHYDKRGHLLARAVVAGPTGDDTPVAIRYDAKASARAGAAGAIYVAGTTYSPAFPVFNAVQTTFGGGIDTFAAVLSADLSTVAFATYFGGSETDDAHGMALDDDGNLVVVGETRSPDLPLEEPLHPEYLGRTDGFIWVVDPGLGNGARRTPRTRFASYFGDDGFDRLDDVAVDRKGRLHLVGIGEPFERVNPLPGDSGATSGAVAVALLDLGLSTRSAAPRVRFASYFGRSSQGGATTAAAVGVDRKLRTCFAGRTTVQDLAVLGAVQTAPGGGRDGFAACISSAKSAVTFATYLGGSADDEITGLAVDRKGTLHVAGNTESDDFPLVGALQSDLVGTDDVFVARLSVQHGSRQAFRVDRAWRPSTLAFSTYFGGSAIGIFGDEAHGIAADRKRATFVTGETSSTDFPLLKPADDLAESREAYVFKVRR